MNISQLSDENLNKRLGLAHNAKAKAEREYKELMEEWRRRHGEDVGTSFVAGGVSVTLGPNRRFNAEYAAEILKTKLDPEVFAAISKTVVDSKKAQDLLPPKLYRDCSVEAAPKAYVKIK